MTNVSTINGSEPITQQYSKVNQLGAAGNKFQLGVFLIAGYRPLKLPVQSHKARIKDWITTGDQVNYQYPFEKLAGYDKTMNTKLKRPI